MSPYIKWFKERSEKRGSNRNLLRDIGLDAKIIKEESPEMKPKLKGYTFSDLIKYCPLNRRKRSNSHFPLLPYWKSHM